MTVTSSKPPPLRCAFVELRPWYFGDASDLLDYCRSRLAEPQIPRSITFVTDWPMSASKIQKPRLAKLLN